MYLYLRPIPMHPWRLTLPFSIATLRATDASERVPWVTLCYVMLCYVYFSSGGPGAPKVPYWGTGRAGLKSPSIP
jgi:hypothetical protein